MRFIFLILFHFRTFRPPKIIIFFSGRLHLMPQSIVFQLSLHKKTVQLHFPSFFTTMDLRAGLRAAQLSACTLAAVNLRKNPLCL